MKGKIFNLLLILMTTILLIAYANPAYSQYGAYTSEELFTIPWGDDVHEIPPDFMLDNPEVLPTSAPGPWEVSNVGTLAIIYYTFENGFEDCVGYLKTFDCAGTFQNSFLLSSVPVVDGVFAPGNIAFSFSGKIALAEECGSLIIILDSTLNMIAQVQLPFEEQTIWGVWPSFSGGFYVVFQAGNRKGQYTKQNFFLCSLSTSGVLSEPLIIWDAENKTGLPAQFVTPLGELTLVYKDEYGYFYGPTEHISGGWEYGSAISKRSHPNGPRIYRNDWQSEESWRRFDNRDYGSRYYITWSGDYYTIHATDAGMVLTKYTYQPE